jgi:hypothetical protein
MYSKYTTLGEIVKRFEPKLSTLCTALGELSGAALSSTLFFNEIVKKARKSPAIRAGLVPLPRQIVEDIVKECQNIGLQISIIYANRLISDIESGTLSGEYFHQKCNELIKRIEDELSIVLLFSISNDKQYLVNQTNLFGDDVSKAFPSTTIDIEEAAKCLAFERFTACVFHMMRATEIGLNVLSNSLNLPPSTNRNWDSLLKKCELELSKPIAQRSPEWALDDVFYSGAAAMLRSIKDAWRNPTMHVEKVYTEEQAIDIWNAVKGFMRLLATKLHE